MKDKQPHPPYIMDAPTSWMFSVGRLLVFVGIVALVGGVARLYTSSAATLVPVTGQVYDTRTGQGIVGVAIIGCNGHQATTVGEGKWSFSVSMGSSYCARIGGGIPAGYSGPTTPGNRNPHSSSKTYEYQVAGVDCIHVVSPSCDANSQSWDRQFDTGVDFAYTSPAPLPVPQPTPTPNPIPTPTPTPNPAPKSPTTTHKSTNSNPGTQPAAPDTTAPSAPSGFTASIDTLLDEVSLTWQAATDNVGVSAYQLERSSDQQNWDVLDANLSDTSYGDQTADFGSHYYYRVKALDAAGNSSDYATTDATMSDFRANTRASKDTRITSDDKLATVLIPSGALDADSFCSLATTTDLLPPNFGGYTFIAGPYTLVCRDSNGDSATDFKKPLVLSAQVSRSALKGVSQVQYFGQNSKSWQRLTVTAHNKKTLQDQVKLNSYRTFVVMGKQKKTSIWIILFEIVVAIAAVVFGLRFLVRWRIRRRAQMQDEDYLHKSRGF